MAANETNWSAMVAAWKREQARADRLEAALIKVRGLCPATDPGPAADPVWGDWKSEGNTDDVASDYRAEGLWEVAVVCDEALKESTDGQ